MLKSLLWCLICEVGSKETGKYVFSMCKVSHVLPMQSSLFPEIFGNSSFKCLLILKIFQICNWFLLLRLLKYLFMLCAAQSWFLNFSANLSELLFDMFLN